MLILMVMVIQTGTRASIPSSVTRFLGCFSSGSIASPRVLERERMYYLVSVRLWHADCVHTEGNQLLTALSGGI